MSWQTVKLGDLCQFVRGPFGGALKKENFVDDGFAVYEQQHAIYDQFENIRYFVNEQKFHEMKRFELNEGDLIMSCSGTMGKVAIVPKNIKKGIINQALLKLTPNKDLDLVFLKRFMESGSFQFELNDNTHGAAIKNVASVSILKDLKIPLPPLPEQKRIAAILDKADELKRKREATIAKLDQLAQSIFVEMFGDPLTNPKRYESLCLQEIAIKVTDGEHLNPVFSEQGMPIVMAGNVLEDSIDFENAKNVKIEFGEKFRKKCNPEPNDILVVSRGATIGRMTIVYDLKAFCLMGSVILIKLNKSKVDPFYLSTLLKFPHMRSALYKTSGSSAQQAIYLKDLKNLSCIAPPLNMQLKFSERLRAINSLKDLNKAAMVKQSTFFTSLQHQAFAGHL